MEIVPHVYVSHCHYTRDAYIITQETTRTATINTVATALFQVNWFIPLGFFLQLSWKRTFGIHGTDFLRTRRPFYHPINSDKALKETDSMKSGRTKQETACIYETKKQKQFKTIMTSVLTQALIRWTPVSQTTDDRQQPSWTSCDRWHSQQTCSTLGRLFHPISPQHQTHVRKHSNDRFYGLSSE